MNLKEKYEKEVVPKMMELFGYKNPLEVPKIEKVVINTGFGKMISGKTPEEQKKIINAILEDLTLISGQKPVITLARQSISSFKVKKGQPQGAKVTLRRKRMYDFLERLIYITLPRSRDFKGIDVSSFDQKGNLTIGIKEHTAFPEISIEKTKFIFGLEITIGIKSKSKEEAIQMLQLLGFPIKK
ncbi:50S ribosomal protein L5 [Candidatus Parcubacteria bacterium]|nr:50S ribosomal protein L5 [Candidatus Parcubacteria bacterium]